MYTAGSGLREEPILGQVEQWGKGVISNDQTYM